MAKFKGYYFYLLKSYLKEKHGLEAFENFLSKLEPEVREHYEGMILSENVYEFSIQKRAFEVVEEQFGKETVEDVGSFMAEKCLSGFFGFFVKKLITLETVLDKTPEWFRKSFEGGEIKIEHERKTVKFNVEGIDMGDAYSKSFEFFLKRLLEMTSNEKIINHNSKRVNETHYEFTYNFQ